MSSVPGVRSPYLQVPYTRSKGSLLSVWLVDAHLVQAPATIVTGSRWQNPLQCVCRYRAQYSISWCRQSCIMTMSLPCSRPVTIPRLFHEPARIWSCIAIARLFIVSLAGREPRLWTQVLRFSKTRGRHDGARLTSSKQIVRFGNVVSLLRSYHVRKPL